MGFQAFLLHRSSPLQNCVIPAAARLRAESWEPGDLRPFSETWMRILEMWLWIPDEPLRYASRLSGKTQFVEDFLVSLYQLG